VEPVVHVRTDIWQTSRYEFIEHAVSRAGTRAGSRGGRTPRGRCVIDYHPAETSAAVGDAGYDVVGVHAREIPPAFGGEETVFVGRRR
jgi:hypothetical protein